MMKNYRSTIIGFAVLIVLLSAGAAQSLSGSNTVFTDDIASGNVFNSDLATNAVTGAKIYPNTVTGADVNESTLVPTCPAAAPNRAGDVCYTSQQPGSQWLPALTACGNLRLRLPSVSEAFVLSKALNSGILIWSDSAYLTSSYRVMIVDSTGPYDASMSGVSNYRCVTTVGARP